MRCLREHGVGGRFIGALRALCRTRSTPGDMLIAGGNARECVIACDKVQQMCFDVVRDASNDTRAALDGLDRRPAPARRRPPQRHRPGVMLSRRFHCPTRPLDGA